MADPIGTAKQIVKMALAIRRAVQTVRRNEEECRDIEQLATRVSSILSQLLETAAAAATSDPAMDGAMAALERSLDRALKLVTSCQKRSTMHRVCAAGAMARQLRRVQDDILRQMVLGVFATTTQLTLSLNMLVQPGAGAPPPAHPPRSGSRWPSSLGIEARIRHLRFSGLEATAGLKKFSLSELETATDHFSEENIIGRGGHSIVYKGVLDDGLMVAIKLYNPSSRIPADRLHERVHDELRLVSKLRHKNFVNFLGYCLAVEEVNEDEGSEDESFRITQVSSSFMVGEYMPNASLDRIINGIGSRLHWSSVFHIIQGIAQGVKILHDRNIVHLDLKPSNILLDSDFNPKIGDFGVARELDLGENDLSDNHFVGSMRYTAPEYYGNRRLKSSTKGESLMKKDVYGFGVTLLDILSSMCISEAARCQPSLEWLVETYMEL
ncbi:hypothetical protein SORBI_3004G212600 [Sorghum bicolor]|uniref:non-specific serine/threonine protein kinase n=1 Tax=Sorghum bicolor TaxID=4558 RepID=A0A1Z5RP21_SORBI|nr:hypothetical protein SORBI_3004G212600 [Sorghum bicolor]